MQLDDDDSLVIDSIEDAIPQVRFLPVLGSHDGSPTHLDAASQNGVATLPCFPLESGDDAQIVPDSKGVVLIISEPRYMAMMKDVNQSTNKKQSGRSACFVATQIVRGQEEEQDVQLNVQNRSQLKRGMLVKLKGLQRNPELNGSVGKLLYFSNQRNRWDVDIEDDVGVRALKLENLDAVPEDTAHKTFGAWRTSTDAGGRWHLAEIGVLLHLDHLKEVKVMKKKGDTPMAGYKCTFSAVGRALIRRVLNPAEFAEKSTYMLADVEDFEDIDKECKYEDHQQGVLSLLKKVLDLHNQALRNVNILPKEDIMKTFKASRGANFWELVRFWQGFLRMQILVSKLKDASEILFKKLIKAFPQIAEGSLPSSFNINDFPPELQEELKALKLTADLTFFERANIERALPLQQLIQASTHREKLQILEVALLREKGRLEAGIDQASSSEEEASDDSESAEPPAPSGKLRSKL